MRVHWPQSNLLRKPDPRVNVVDEKLQEALAWFRSHPAVRRAPAAAAHAMDTD